MRLREDKRFYLFSLLIFAGYVILLGISGYFSIGLISDDYLNFFDATSSTLMQKFTGKLPFTNELHFRPLYYLSLEISENIRQTLGFNYDNFILFRIQNLILLLILAYIAGKIIIDKTRRVKLALIGVASILLYPNNLHNICWTAARIDLLCGVFYLLTIYFSIKYIERKVTTELLFSLLCLTLALLTKETGITIPFTIILLAYFYYSWNEFRSAKILFFTQIGLLVIYFVFRFIFLKGNIANAFMMYQSNPLANMPAVFGKSLLALNIPLDFLTLSYWMQIRPPELTLYLLILYGSAFYFLYILFKEDTSRFVMQLSVLVIVLILPYMLIGYVRPQMILIPFSILVIYLFVTYHNRLFLKIKLNNRITTILYLLLLAYWSFWSYGVVNDWVTSYNLSRISMNNLLNAEIKQERYTIIAGNHGRLKQSMMFDKQTGSMNYWLYKNFVVKDTINDIIQTGAIDEPSLLSEIKYNKISDNEYEMTITGQTQFFYIEGFDTERLKAGFKNDYMSVEFTEFKFQNKATKLKLKILSPLSDLFLASGLNFIKLN